jgi:hypothetical protein
MIKHRTTHILLELDKIKKLEKKVAKEQQAPPLKGQAKKRVAKKVKKTAVAEKNKFAEKTRGHKRR